MNLQQSFDNFEKAFGRFLEVVIEKHGSHDQSTHGRGGGGSAGGSRSGKRDPKTTVKISHGTSAELVDKILKEGLIPFEPATEGHYSADSPEGLGKQPKAVYATTKGTNEAAEWGSNAVQKWNRKDQADIVVFEIEMPRSSLEFDPIEKGAVISRERIPPEAIKAVSFYKATKFKGVEKQYRMSVVDGKLKSMEKKETSTSLFVPMIVEESGGDE